MVQTSYSVALLLPLVLLALLGLAGIVLLALGLRGRRVGDHPHCRRCGFDLIARPAGSMKCPECGSDLTRPHSTQTGLKRRRPVPLLAGAVMMLLSASILGVAGYAASRQANFNPYKPVWLLTRELGSADPSTREAAIAEIRSRISAGKISDAQLNALTSRALALQADTTRPWVSAWGDLVEQARKSGKLSDVDWQRYARQAVSPRIEVRPDVRRGDPFPCWIVKGPARVGNNSGLVLKLRNEDVKVEITGVRLPDAPPGSSSASSLGPSGTSKSSHAIDLPQVVDRLKDGAQTLRLWGEVTIRESWEGPALVTVPFDTSANWTLHPAGKPTVTVVRDESLRAAITAALRIEQTQLRARTPPSLDVTVTVRNNPVGVAFDLFARQGDKSWKLGSFACPRKTNGSSWSLGREVRGWRAGAPTDILLKPSMSAAVSATDTVEMWDGEVVIKGVKVTLPAPPRPGPSR